MNNEDVFYLDIDTLYHEIEDPDLGFTKKYFGESEIALLNAKTQKVIVYGSWARNYSRKELQNLLRCHGFTGRVVGTLSSI